MSTYGLLAMFTMQAVGPFLYEMVIRGNYLPPLDIYIDGDGWDNPDETGWDDFAAQPNKIRLA